MHDHVIDANAVRAWVTLGVLLLVINYAMMPLLADNFRQRMFKLRRELFLDRADGIFSADDRAYRLLMHQMHAVIRFAESVTLGRTLVATIAVSSSHRTILVDDFAVALEAMDPVRRARLRDLHARALEEMAHHILRTAPVIWILYLLLLPIGMVVRTIRGLLQVPVRYLAKADSVNRLAINASALLPDDAAFAA